MSSLHQAKTLELARKDEETAIDVLARTLWGEARGEGAHGMEAVASVIMNRVALARSGECRWWGSTVTEVCLKQAQFSCWLAGDPNRSKLETVTDRDSVFAMCLRIARRAVRGQLQDRTSGATHYHADGTYPSWAKGHSPTVRIGHHWFYRLEG